MPNSIGMRRFPDDAAELSREMTLVRKAALAGDLSDRFTRKNQRIATYADAQLAQVIMWRNAVRRAKMAFEGPYGEPTGSGEFPVGDRFRVVLARVSNRSGQHGFSRGSRSVAIQLACNPRSPLDATVPVT